MLGVWAAILGGAIAYAAHGRHGSAAGKGKSGCQGDDEGDHDSVQRCVGVALCVCVCGYDRVRQRLGQPE